MLKTFMQRLGLILGGILVAFVVAEIAVRVLNLAPAEFYTYDRYVGWKMKPNYSGWQKHEGVALMESNSEGFRGPEYSLVKPPGTLRIAVLGDSFAEAQHVAFEDTFCSVIQRDLQGQCPFAIGGDDKSQRLFTNVEVMNFGCDGYGTAQELQTLRHSVWQYSPDVIVLAFFNGNDVRNNSVVLEGDKCRPFFVHKGDNLVLGGPFEDSWWFRTHCMLRFESRLELWRRPAFRAPLHPAFEVEFVSWNHRAQFVPFPLRPEARPLILEYVQEERVNRWRRPR